MEESFNTSLQSALKTAADKGANKEALTKLAQTMQTDFSNQKMVHDTYTATQNAKGFGSKTIQNVDAFSDKNTDDYTNSLADGLIKYNPIGQGTNYNPLSQIGSTAANAVGDVGSVLKGLWSIVRHPIDFANQVAEDPTLLVGPAAQQILTGTASAIRNHDLGALWKGVEGAATSFTNHPILSILPFLGAEDTVGTVKDFASNPVEALKGAGKDAAGKTKGAAEATVNAITDPLGTVKSITNKLISPFAQIANKLNTASQIEKGITDYTGKADANIADLTKKNESNTTALEDLKAADKNSPQIERLKVEQEKTAMELEAASQARASTLNTGLAQIELLKRVSTGDVPVSEMGQGLAGVLDNIGTTVRKGYEEVLPRGQYPSMQPIVEGLQKFSEEISQGTNSGLKKAVLEKIDQLMTKETIRDAYTSATSPEEVTRALAKKGLIGTTESPVSASFLKTTLQGELRDALVKDNPSYGKVWQDTVAPKIDEAIKAGLDETQKKAYDNLNSHYRALDGNGLAEKFRSANTESKVLRLLKDPDVRKALQTLHPALVDLANHVTMRDILEKSWDAKKGVYNAEKLNSLLDENKPVLDQSDYLATKSLALHLRELGSEAEKAVSKQETVGSTPAEVFKNIQKIKSVDDLQAFSEASGLSAEEVGKVYAKGLAESIDPKFAKDGKFTASKDIKNDMANLKKLDEGLQKFGTGTPEGEALRETIFGKEGLKAIDDLHNARLNLEELSKAEGTSAMKKAAKVVFGGILATMKFYWTGARLMKEGLSTEETTGKTILGNESRQSPPTPKPVKPKKVIIKPVLKAGGEAANAAEDNQ